MWVFGLRAAGIGISQELSAAAACSFLQFVIVGPHPRLWLDTPCSSSAGLSRAGPRMRPYRQLIGPAAAAAAVYCHRQRRPLSKHVEQHLVTLYRPVSSR